MRQGLPGLRILPLLSWAIFKSLWFEQEAIGQVFLGKDAFAEKNYSPSLGKIRGGLPGCMAENGLNRVMLAQGPTSLLAPQRVCSGQSPARHEITHFSLILSRWTEPRM